MKRMKRCNSRGQTLIEFLFVLLWAVPFLLLTIALGINLIDGLEVIQMARDTASMYARNVDFTQPASGAILDTIGNGLTMHHDSTALSKTVVILSELTYMDGTCSAATASGCSTCSNSGQWVFIQYQILPGAITTIASKSQYGDPSGLVTVTNPKIPICTAASNPAAIASNFAARGITSWSTTGATLGWGVPTGMGVFLVEVTTAGYPVPPFLNAPVKLYNYAIF